MAEEGFAVQLWNLVAKEWHVIMRAKRVFGSAAVLLVSASAAGVWFFVGALYRAEVAGLNATIQAQRATIDFLNTKAQPPSGKLLPVPSSDNGIDYSNLRPLTTLALRTETGRLAKDLREFEATYYAAMQTNLMPPRSRGPTQEAFDAMTRKSQELARAENYDYQTKYRSRVLAIYEELCRRLGITPINGISANIMVSDGKFDANGILKYGLIAGVHPINMLADYLETLAGQLR